LPRARNGVNTPRQEAHGSHYSAAEADQREPEAWANKDGRAWRIGGEADVDWIRENTCARSLARREQRSAILGRCLRSPRPPT